MDDTTFKKPWAKFLRRLPSFKSKMSLAKFFFGRQLTGVRDIYMQDSFENKLLLPSLEEPIAQFLLINGFYEIETCLFMKRHLLPGNTFIDVGANVGIFSLQAAATVGPKGRVFAVEPSPQIIPYLRRNVDACRFSNITLLDYALSGEDGCARFYLPSVDKFGMGSMGFEPGWQSVEVRTKTLDRLAAENHIASADMVKVDVEGFEARVFEGGAKLLTGDKSPLIVFEFCDWAEKRAAAAGIGMGQAQKILNHFGYAIWKLGDFLRGKPALKDTLTEGFCMLVAKRISNPGSK